MNLILFSNIALYSQFSGGYGTEQDPYQLSNIDDLMALGDSLKHFDINVRRKYRDKHYVLTNNITDTLYTSMGNNGDANINMCFSGVFDGQNHSIILHIVNKGPLAALFKCIQSNAVVKNLILFGYLEGMFAVIYSRKS